MNVENVHIGDKVYRVGLENWEVFPCTIYRIVDKNQVIVKYENESTWMVNICELITPMEMQRRKMYYKFYDSGDMETAKLFA